MILNQGRFCLASSLLPSHPHPERWAVSADILACHILGDAADTEGMETREAAKHPLSANSPHNKIIQPRMSVVLRLKNPALKEPIRETSGSFEH